MTLRQIQIQHYPVIFTVNMSELNFRLFELFTIKSEKITPIYSIITDIIVYNGTSAK